MKGCISAHVTQKHLVKNTDASVFLNKDIMMFCIRQCFNDPDRVKLTSNKFVLEKDMKSNIGVLGYAKTLTNKVRVICNKKKDFVVSAYPIK